MKSIIVTEKASVARTFAKVLGVNNKENGYFENDEWIITWCRGHLVTMSYPEKYDEELKKWTFDTLPFLPEKYLYEVISESKDQFMVIKKLYNRKDIGYIFYAGDAAREGLYIQMLVRRMAFASKPSLTEMVVWIDSQTDAEIKRGIKEAKPLTAYKNLADAGYLRAIEDYLVGINLSRALSIKYGRTFLLKNPIAVGRVMTCVLAMVVEREREIRDFVPTSFYKISAVDKDKNSFSWKANKEAKIYQKIEPYLYDESGFKSESVAKNFAGGLGGNLCIKSIEKKTEKKYAPLLYNLAELQNDCSKLFKLSPDETLDIAEDLYIAQLITYPRSDARVLSSAVADEIHINLNGIRNRGDNEKFISKIKNPSDIKNTKYTDDSKISDHYAVIPTGKSLHALDSMDDMHKAVYDIIEKRFISIFMPPAIYEKTSVFAVDDKRNEQFYLKGSVLKDEGFMAVSGKTGDNEEIVVPFKEGDVIPVSFEVVKGETKPKSHYTSGSIILAMENAGKLIEDEELREQIKSCGIGTSATRAEILKKLIATNNLSLNKKTQVLSVTKFGELIYDVVKDSIPEMCVPEMTAKWEQALENVANGKLSRTVYQSKINEYVTRSVDKVKDVTVSEGLKKQASDLGDNYIGSNTTPSKPRPVKAGEIETYINVSFEDKEKVKALGARFDGVRKMWYVPKGLDIKKFEEYVSCDKPQTSVKKLYLKVPFEDKDEAKNLGAKWDMDKKSWFIMSMMDQNKFSKWL